MATPEKHRPTMLDQALAQLKRDPSHPIRLVVDGMEIELRRPTEPAMIPGPADQSNLGDRMAAIGPWQGESTEEIIQILRQARRGDGKLPELL